LFVPEALRACLISSPIWRGKTANRILVRLHLAFEHFMIIAIRGTAGQFISLDLRAPLGEHVEIESFYFLVPPIEFRLVRNGVALQAWQPGNTEMYDLQHPAHARVWQRHGHWFVNDLDHRDDAMTCGVLSKDLALETRDLGFSIELLVGPRESTCRPGVSTTTARSIL
jgi:hypothetical protein